MRVLLAATLLALPFPALAQEQEEEGGFFSGLFGRDAAQEEDDEGFLTGFIEERLSATARNVDIQGFAGALSSRATIDLLTIADAEGVWLRAEDLALQWNRSALLSGRIEVDELAVGSIEVLRPPIPDPALPQPEATPFRLPELPVSVEIGELRSDRIVLGEELLGEELVLALAGGVNLEGGEGTANLSAEILQGSEGRFDFAGGYSNETRVLSVTLDLEEAEGGLAARALGIPDQPAIALRIEGTAPIDDYQATLELATDGEERIAGTFALKTTEEPGEGYVVERAFGLDVRGDVTPLLAADAGAFLGEDVVLRTKGIRRSDGSLVLTSLGIRGEAIALNGQAEITPEGWPARIALRGEIGVEAGTPVPLPLVGDTTVRGVMLDVTYDRAQGEAWTGTFQVEDLTRPGLTIRGLDLQGGGTIEPATQTETGRFTADLAYEAQGLAFTDTGLGAALGADLQGVIDLVRTEDGGPLRIRELTLAGPGIEAQAEGTVAGPDTGFLTQSSIQLGAQDLARFATLTGLDLGGAADITIVSSVRPLDRIFDLVLSGTTQDLALGVDTLDPLLAGAGEVTVAAVRDEAGLRVSTLSIATDAVTATGDADITSGASRGDFDLAIADLGLSFPDLSGPGTVRGSFRRDDNGQGSLDAEAALPGATVSVDAEIGANVPLPRGRQGPGLVTFEAEASVEELEDYRNILATFAPDLPVAPSGGTELRLSGTTELDLDLFDLTVDARTQDLKLGQRAFDAVFAGEGRLQGRVIRTGFDALRVEDLRVDTPLLDGTLTADLGEGTGTADLDLRLTDVEPVMGGLSGPGAVTGTAARAADGSTALDLDLSLPTGTASVDGTLASDGGVQTFTGDLAADLGDISPLGTLLGRDLAGAVQGTASGTARLDLSTLDLTFDLATEDLELGIPRLDPFLAGQGTFTGRAARDGDDLRLDAVRIDTDLLDGTVSAQIEDGVGSADIDLALADVEPVLGGIEGPGRLSGTARQTAEGTTALDLDLSLPTGTAQVEGTLGTPEDGYVFTGDILADFEDLAPLGTLLERDLGGVLRADLSGTIRPDLSALDVTFDATARDLETGIPQIDRLLAGEGTVTGRAARDGTDLLLEDLRIDTDLVQGTISAEFEDGVGSADLDLALSDVAPVLGGLSGEGRITGTARQTGEGTTALDLDLALPTGTARVEGTLGTPLQGFAFTGDILADFEDIAPLGALLGRDLQGALRADLTGTIRPDLSVLDVTFDATARDLALGVPQLDRLLAGEGTFAGSLARDGADLRLDGVRIDTTLVQGTVSAEFEDGVGSADVDLSLPDVAPVLGGLSGEGRITGTARQTGEGTTDLDLRVALPTGEATVDGTLEGGAEGLAFAGDVAADFEDVAPLGTLLGRDLAGAVQGTASGTARLDLSALDLAFDLATRDLEVGIPLLDPLLAGEGTLAGRAARDGDDLRLEDVRIDTDLLDGTVTAAFEDGVGSADVDLTLADVEPILGGLSGEGRITGTARQTGEGTTDLDLRVALPTGEATVDGTLAGPEEGFAFTGDLAADFEDIAPLGTLLGRDLAGAVDATATGTIRPDLSVLDLAFEGATRDLRTGVAPLDTLLAGEGTVAGRATRSGPTSFRLDDVTVQTDLLLGTVTAEFENGEGAAELDVTLTDVAPVLGGLSGPGRITGTASGTGGGLVDLDLEATLPTGTASAEGTLDLAQGNLFTGDLAADFDDISPLGPLVGRDLGGAVSGAASGTVRPDLSAFDLTFDLGTQDLRLGQPVLDLLLAGPGAFSGRAARSENGDLVLDLDADTPQIRGDVEGSFGAGTGQGRFDVALADLGLIAPGFSGPATAVGEATRAPDGSVAVDARATGPGLSAVVDATIAPPDQGGEISGTADVSLADLSLLAPFVGRPLSGGFDGTVSGSLLPSLARFDLAVDGTARDLAIGNPQVDVLLAGTGAVSARLSRAEGGAVAIQSLVADFPNLDVTASGDANALTFQASLTDAALLAPAFPGAVSATGTASFGPGGVTVEADVAGPGGLSTRVSGPLGATTDLSLTGTAPLALFNRIIDPRRLDGPADFDLRLTGPGLEFLEGTVTTAGARLADPTLGEAIRNIRGTARLSGGVATLDLVGDLALGGRLAVTGPVGITSPFLADLQIVGTDLVIRDPTLYEAFGNARLSVTGPLAGGALIAGVVDLDRVEGRVPASGVGALGDVPDVFHIQPSLPVVETLRRAGLSPTGEEISPETGARRGGGAGYGLDILLRAPSQVFLRGRGLDAELGGELRLTGTTQDVIPIGQFNLIRGRLDLLGQRFELTEGSATLQGDFNPFIRVVAETEARTGTRVAVVVEGPLASPEVSFESTPELPEDEVLAQLLFGVDIESITPLQAVRLASAVATLAGEGTGLLDDLRGGIGLADFDVTTTEGGNIALRLGQYISENVYTDVVISPEETEATINLDLTPDLTVRAGVSTRGDTSLGIFFERDY